MAWLDERQQAAWDLEIEQDFSPGGRGMFLLDEVRADIASGRTEPLHNLLAEAPKNSKTSR